MTPEETGKILGLCASYDNRNTEDAATYAWYRAIGDLPFAECEAAVIAHYSESREWIMPADVRTRVKRQRRDEAERGRIKQLLDPAAYRREVEQAGADLVSKLKALGAGVPDRDEPLTGWKAVECPACHVKPGDFCLNPKTGDKTATHRERHGAAGT